MGTKGRKRTLIMKMILKITKMISKTMNPITNPMMINPMRRVLKKKKNPQVDLTSTTTTRIETREMRID